MKRLLGILNYLQKFAPNLSEVTAPTRELLKEENHFLWDEEVQGRSFERVKQHISESPVLKYFDPKAVTELQCDPSDMDLGACLMPHGQPVGYASRAMTKAEVNYAQIEKEVLAIVLDLNDSNSMPKEDQSRSKQIISLWKASLRRV